MLNINIISFKTFSTVVGCTRIPIILLSAVYLCMFDSQNLMTYLPKVVMKQNAMIEQLKQKKTMTPEEREENQR